MKSEGRDKGVRIFQGAPAQLEQLEFPIVTRVCASVRMHCTATRLIERFNPQDCLDLLNPVDVNILTNSDLFRPSESILLRSKFRKLSPLRYSRSHLHEFHGSAGDDHGLNADANPHLKFLGACKD